MARPDLPVASRQPPWRGHRRADRRGGEDMDTVGRMLAARPPHQGDGAGANGTRPDQDTDRGIHPAALQDREGQSPSRSWRGK